VGGRIGRRHSSVSFLLPRIIKQVFQSQGLAVKEGALNVCLYGIVMKEKVVQPESDVWLLADWRSAS